MNPGLSIFDKNKSVPNVTPGFYSNENLDNEIPVHIINQGGGKKNNYSHMKSLVPYQSLRWIIVHYDSRTPKLIKS